MGCKQELRRERNRSSRVGGEREGSAGQLGCAGCCLRRACGGAHAANVVPRTTYMTHYLLAAPAGDTSCAGFWGWAWRRGQACKGRQAPVNARRKTLPAHRRSRRSGPLLRRMQQRARA